MKGNKNQGFGKKDRKKIVIIGAQLKGHAGVVLSTLELIKGYKVVGFIDNTPELQGGEVNGISVIGSTDDLDAIAIPGDCVHISIGDNVARGKVYNKLKKRGVKIETIIHPDATVSERAVIGEGCFVGPQAVINNGTVLGPVTIINSGSVVEHDNVIGFAVHLAPGTKTTGLVHIDDYAFIGVGSTILPNIHIGSGAMIGAGATVVKDVPPKTTVFGYAGKKHTKNIYLEAKSDVHTDPERIYVAQPTLPEYPLLDEKFRDIARSLSLSNFAKYSTQLEVEVQEKLKVKKALTLPNGTTALMLALKALNLTGEVIMPSFTFSATGHAVAWNGLTPVFADIDPRTFNIDPKDVEKKITKKTTAIIGVHIFGNPADIKKLEGIARRNKLKLIFDSAHALGSTYQGVPIGGFGDVECFSLSGTKIITSAEGGLATSNNVVFMEKMHLGRNYGAGPDYNCQYVGINGKMSEFHAAIAIESLSLLDKFIVHRNKLVQLYIKRLSEIPGISFQFIPEGHVSTYKDFSILINKEEFGLDRDALVRKLNEEGIYPKTYFYPLHRMTAYEKVSHRADGLKNTEAIADNIVCLPIFSHMTEDTLEKICFAVFRIWKKAKG